MHGNCGGDQGREERRQCIRRRRDIRSCGRNVIDQADHEPDQRRHRDAGPARMQDHCDAAGGHAETCDQPRAIGGRAPRFAEFLQARATGFQIEMAIDDLVGNLVDLAQALQVHVAGRHAHDLGDFGETVFAHGIGERHHDRGRRRQHNADEAQPRADQVDHVFKARRGGAVLVQAPRQLDDEADAGLEGGVDANPVIEFLDVHGCNDAVLCVPDVKRWAAMRRRAFRIQQTPVSLAR